MSHHRTNDPEPKTVDIGPTFILNVNPSGMDILHNARGLTESCNTDDIVDRSRIDSETADALVSMGEARRCEHCFGGAT